MAYALRIWPKHGLHVLEFSGRLDANTIKRATTEYFERPDATEHKHQIVDLAKVEEYDLGFERLIGVVRFKTPYMQQLGPGTRYILHGPTDTDFGMARMYQQMTQDVYPFQIEVARSWPEAMRLAGIDARSPDELVHT